MRKPCKPTNTEKRIWKVKVSSLIGRLVDASPNAHPRPNTTARVIAIVKSFLVDSNLVASLLLVIVPCECLQMDTMITMNIIQLKM